MADGYLPALLELVVTQRKSDNTVHKKQQHQAQNVVFPPRLSAAITNRVICGIF
jgi:hypothetical protein